MAQIHGDEQPKRRKLDLAAVSGQASAPAGGSSLGLDPAAVVRIQAQRDICEELLRGWARDFEQRCDEINEGLDGLELQILEFLDGLEWIALQPIVEPEDSNQMHSAVGPFWKNAGAYLGDWNDTVSQWSIDLKRFKELVQEHDDVAASLQASAELVTTEPS